MASQPAGPDKAGAVSRRHFVKAVALAGASFPFAACANQAVGQADLVVEGGTFLPMDPSLTQVDAMAIRGDRIIAIGRTQDIEALVGPNTHRIDARNLTVTPGFIDAHSHPMMANEAISVDVNFRTIGEVQDAIIRQADKTPSGEWVQAHMYDDTKFEEGRPLNREDIDQVVQSHPGDGSTPRWTHGGRQFPSSRDCRCHERHSRPGGRPLLSRPRSSHRQGRRKGDGHLHGRRHLAHAQP